MSAYTTLGPTEDNACESVEGGATEQEQAAALVDEVKHSEG